LRVDVGAGEFAGLDVDEEPFGIDTTVARELRPGLSVAFGLATGSLGQQAEAMVLARIRNSFPRSTRGALPSDRRPKETR
jgi:hypothetical protein